MFEPKCGFTVHQGIAGVDGLKGDDHYAVCGADAVVVVIYEYMPANDHGDWDGLCADHAPEGVHEIKCTANESEYLIITLEK